MDVSCRSASELTGPQQLEVYGLIIPPKARTGHEQLALLGLVKIDKSAHKCDKR
jgi:hypothetical protein